MTKLSNERMAELSVALRARGRLPLRPGVLNLKGWQVSGGPNGDDNLIKGVDYGGGMSLIYEREEWEAVPLDLNDDATVGVLAGYARELWGELWGDEALHLRPNIYYYLNEERVSWHVYNDDSRLTNEQHNTRAEAWVDAILMAPRGGGG